VGGGMTGKDFVVVTGVAIGFPAHGPSVGSFFLMTLWRSHSLGDGGCAIQTLSGGLMVSRKAILCIT
jgi:hypothetical protein